jgi:hypothetical protein
MAKPLPKTVAIRVRLFTIREAAQLVTADVGRGNARKNRYSSRRLLNPEPSVFSLLASSSSPVVRDSALLGRLLGEAGGCQTES